MKPPAKTERETTTIDTFTERFPDHITWIECTASLGNSFAQSLLSQLHRGWMLTAKQMTCIEKNLSPQKIMRL
jgi:hypothetical protein